MSIRTDIPDDTNYRRRKNLIVATGVSACSNIPFIFSQTMTRHLLQHPFLNSSNDLSKIHRELRYDNFRFF